MNNKNIVNTVYQEVINRFAISNDVLQYNTLYYHVAMVFFNSDFYRLGFFERIKREIDIITVDKNINYVQ